MAKNPFPPLYQASLARFLAQPDEDTRQKAYDLGRQALDLKLGLLEMAQLHAQACGVLVEPARNPACIPPEWLPRSAEFFAETAAPFEMELRGYREALERNEALLLQAQRVEALGRLVGGVVHDFNNLLGIISGFTDLALEDSQVGGNPELKQTLQEVAKASRRAADLTRQLLAFTRRQNIEIKPLDLNAVLTDTVQMLQRLLGAGIELRVRQASGLRAVKADPGQLAQVLMNLAINARDAMLSGGVITLSTENVELAADSAGARPQGLAPGPYVLLAVADTGTGMDAETQARIFEPFFTTKAPGAGTGLGLATVYSIVKQYQGALQVESQPGHGSTFKVFLPASAEVAHLAEPSAVALDHVSHGGETLLLVENDASIRRLAVSQLKRAGYHLLEASQAAEALAIAAQDHSFPLVLTDLSMPGISGLELARQLRASRPELKILFVSGSIPDSAVQQYTLGTGTDFLGKPYTGPELVARVRALLDQPLP
jgi:signal transduction histidine kinase